MKKKLSLKLDELTVESFATGDAKDARGTVHGHISNPGCDPSIIDSCPAPGGQTCAHAVSCGDCSEINCVSSIDCSGEISCVLDLNSCA